MIETFGLLFCHVQDANDNAPVFNDTLFTFALLENLPALAMVGGFEATDSDLDTGGEISFTILGMHSDRYGSYGS